MVVFAVFFCFSSLFLFSLSVFVVRCIGTGLRMRHNGIIGHRRSRVDSVVITAPNGPESRMIHSITIVAWLPEFNNDPGVCTLHSVPLGAIWPLTRTKCIYSAYALRLSQTLRIRCIGRKCEHEQRPKMAKTQRISSGEFKACACSEWAPVRRIFEI